MAKLTYEDKKEIIRLYNEEHMGFRTISKKYNIRKINVEKIVRKYALHGEDSLARTYKRLPPSTKFEIINRYKNGISILELQIQYLVTDIQIYKWIKDYEELGYDGLKDRKKGRPPTMKKENKSIDPNDKDAIIEELKRKNLELECEVEALKKLRALVLQRNEQQTKKKR